MTTKRPRVALDGHYSVTEVADMLEVDRKTIYRWRKCGYLKSQRQRHSTRAVILGREILKLFDLGV